LRPFDLGDEDFFFGREAQTRSLYAKLKVNRLIAVGRPIGVWKVFTGARRPRAAAEG
jgi:hypothetical protein